ncbi:ATP-dependent DNA helicase DDX11 isoform X2 [Oratosquilla oratoria]|uniref:ATP-dependent DNA helicase DDX11 isoform X2 n=1 Tax=Oratosquilla oratoria TaxID=337810 RepID=UPI003F776FF7
MSMLQPPSTFEFPFPPYDIQEAFMRNLFHTLQEKKLGIFESPTGTGKSLSLICGALTWLRDYNKFYKDELEKKIAEAEEATKADDGPDWFSAATKRQAIQVEFQKSKVEYQNLLKQEERIASLKTRRQAVKRATVKKVDDEFDQLFKDIQEVQQSVQRELQAVSGENDLTNDDYELLLEDYHSDDDDCWEKKNNEDEEQDCLKIYFCSRTHSQLSQFVREVQKTIFSEETRVVSLASRQNLCINEAVLRLNNSSMVNDRCLELQRGKQNTKSHMDGIVTKKKKTSSGCPFYKQSPLDTFTDQILLEVQDIEQLVTQGKKMKKCPYYGTRQAIKDAQLVVLPYNTLLHKGTREACGIKLKDNIVIVDEAHNLLETIANIHSVLLGHAQLAGAHAQLNHYMNRYGKKLTPSNLLYIKQIIFFISALIKVITSGGKEKKQPSCVMTVPKFLCNTYTDNLNFFKILQYIEKSKIALKLHGFSQKYEPSVQMPASETTKQQSKTSSFLAKMAQPKNSKVPEETPAPVSEKATDENEEYVSGSPLMQITEFMRALLGASVDGRVVIQVGSTPRKSTIKYLLLNPASHFHDIVHKARAVIVAGGTMQPMSEFREQLFITAGAPANRIHEFSCGHVVPGEQLMAITLSHGPTNTLLEFTYQKREDPRMLDELGRVLVNVCTAVPGGIVCFLPSYDYEDKVFTYFQKTGVIQRLSGKKKVFREPKKTNQLDAVLSDYAKTVRLCSTSNTGITGSLLLSVVGGKMSEGINFSDNLGRCVIMVGLPYPNTQSPELKEKMEYLNKNVKVGPDGRLPGQVFYENLCFKSVNQSIGRAIRHRNDYASILLLDQRYERPQSVKALPGWISKHINHCNKFGSAFALMRKFFAGKKSQL